MSSSCIKLRLGPIYSQRFTLSAGLGTVREQLAWSRLFAEALGADHFAVESFFPHGYDTYQLFNQERETQLSGVDFKRI